MRHQFAQDYGIPETYAKMKNPLPNDPQTWALGAAVYTNQCASCHGLSGEGKGPRAPGLATPPANLAWFATLPQSKWDGFIYWTVAEGGEPFGTAMPAYKAKLTDKEIWAVTVFMRHTLGTTRRS
jgi:mono/diheme cytochrome c family protein